MTIQSLSFQALNAPFETIPNQMLEPASDFLSLQERLKSVLDAFLAQQKPLISPFLLLKGDEEPFFESLFKEAVQLRLSHCAKANPVAFHYQINTRHIQLLKDNPKGQFATVDHAVQSAFSFYPTQLFGLVREPENGLLQLEPGLLHQANGGVLILSLTQLLDQPDCFKLLKQVIYNESFPWLPPDPAHPFSMSIPPLPIQVKVILVGNRVALSDLQLIDPLFFNQCFYAEFESEYRVKNNDYQPWLFMIQHLVFKTQQRLFAPTAFKLLIKEGMKYCEDQQHLPCQPTWLTQLLKTLPQSTEQITFEQLNQALEQAKWQLDYLPTELLASVLEKQVTIYTQGEQIGQINGLSVLEYPGYPLEIGETSRISCVLALGEGDVIDVERKTELGGNLHSKGMMIIQSLLDKEFAQQQHLPFDFSLVFEQSYSEVDGDSASLAGFCALLSALSNVPINQQFAVTGSIDQNGNVQTIGGLNQKIESFFNICNERGLTGKQAVIIPKSNQTQLCLNETILAAIKTEQFFIYPVTHFSQAIELLTGLPYDNQTPFNLKTVIRTRLNQVSIFARAQSSRSIFSFLRFLKS